MKPLLYVALGGAAGSAARYLAGVHAARAFGTGWPWGTLIVNVAGGLLMGLLAGSIGAKESWRLLLGVGLLGGFTTFSTYSLEVAQMIERRAYAPAFAYAAGSAVLSIAALMAGLLIARRVLA